MNDYERYKRRLYHSYKNENALPWVIIGSFILIFINNGIPCAIALWFWYICYCAKNNEALNRDPDVLKDREIVRQIEEKYKDK